MPEEKQQLACFGCIGNSFLRHRIKRERRYDICSYCGSKRSCWPIDRIAEVVEPLFSRDYIQVGTSEDTVDGAGLEEILVSYVGVAENIAADLGLALWRKAASTFNKYGDERFTDDARYKESTEFLSRVEQIWREMRHKVHHESRFFSPAVRCFLDYTFAKVESLKDTDGNSVVEILPVGTTIYRARVALDETQLEAILTSLPEQLAAPRGRQARAGRMNAAGVTVFYGAFDAETCLAEVRPPVGCRVVTGGFKLLRAVRVLDFDRLASIPLDADPFDTAYVPALERWQFLRTLNRRFSAAVMPGVEDLEYVLTQMACEYLSEIAAPTLDGIAFPSAQVNGARRNIALFERAATTLKWPRPTESSTTYSYSQTSDTDWEHTVTTEIPKVSNANENGFSDDAWFDELNLMANMLEFKRRDFLPTLELSELSVNVVDIKAVSYEIEKDAVSFTIWDRNAIHNGDF